MGVIRSTVQTGTVRRRIAILGVFSLVVFYAQLTFAGPAAAAAFTGGFSPTIVGGRADLHGHGVVNGADDANEFYGSTHIIDGMLDCDAWGAIANAGSAGDGTIDGTDDCSLVGYDGTVNGVTIEVVNGLFQVGNGPLPTVFNANDPDNPDVGDSQFAWSTIGGRVDANGDETIDGDDCHFGVRGQADILGNLGANECGFVTPPNTADNGLVDLNSDTDITSAGDSCANGCFFRHDVANGVVQALECPGHAGDPRNQVVGTPASETLTGTGVNDIVCGLGGSDVLRGLSGRDLLLGGLGRDRLLGGLGNDRLFGGPGNDRLFGGPGNDGLFGGPGNDRLFGGPGRDHHDGGRGTDLGVGGPGRDTFIRCENRQQ
jgi:Ca2+-binding RTX toxin-like protein